MFDCIQKLMLLQVGQLGVSTIHTLNALLFPVIYMLSEIIYDLL